MPRSTFVQANFTAGELSPRLLGRSDLSKFSNGLQRLENFIVQKHGGIIRRSGTRFIAEVKDSSKLTILIEFQFSVTQTYILEFGDLYIRFYRDKAQLKDSGTPTEIVSPYTEAQLRDISFTQSADILYICHPLHEVRELLRTSGDDSLPGTWSLVEFNSEDGPYLLINPTATTLTPNALSGTGVTITASSTTGINNGEGFKSTDVGRILTLDNAAGVQWGWMEITGFTDTTHVTVTIDTSVPTTNPTKRWKLGAWSDTTGWPHTATFHQERLWFGADNAQPQRLVASKIGDFNNMEPFDPSDETVRPDDAINFIISSDRVDAVRNLTSDAEGLIVLTEGGTFLARSSGGDQDAITPVNFGITRQHTFGAHDTVRPHQVGSTLLYVTSDGRKVREQVFRFEDNRFVSPDMTLLAEHITVGGVVDSAYQQEPDSLLWLVRNDGQLLGLTFERSESVIGWHRHILGGSLTGSQHPEVESAAVIRDGNDDLLWLVVKRTIGGVTKRYIEFVQVRFGVDTAIADGFFVDSGLTYDGTAVTLITGLDHLEGETVDIMADGATIGPQLVTGGSITLAVAAKKVHAGLAFKSRAKSMPLIPAPTGFDPRAKRKRVYKLLLDLHNTLGGRMGTDSQLDEIIYRTPSDPMDAPPPLFTGIKEMSFPGQWDRNPTVSFETTGPQPMTILNLIAEMTVGGV